MPKSTLIYYTGKFAYDDMFAARLLAFTKNTRLTMDENGFEAFLEKDEIEIIKEMEYMATTIPSSWEFVDFIFLFTGVSRATAQQVTRTRTASFAMQSQRVNDMSDVKWDTPNDTPDMVHVFDMAMTSSVAAYSDLVSLGMSLEDARDLLPVGAHCNLVAKYNLRTLVELCQKRDSLRVQGPYVDLVKQMKSQVLEAMPWAEAFFRPKQETTIALIEEVAKELASMGGEKGAMYKGLTGKLAKAADLLKGSQ